MTRRTFGLGMSGVALTLLGTNPTEETPMAQTPPPLPPPPPPPPPEDPPHEGDRPYHETN